MNSLASVSIQERPFELSTLQQRCVWFAQHIRMITLRFTIGLDVPAVLARFKGSTLRGLFGTAFREAMYLPRSRATVLPISHYLRVAVE
jgi:hypothetical protein